MQAEFCIKHLTGAELLPEVSYGQVRRTTRNDSELRMMRRRLTFIKVNKSFLLLFLQNIKFHFALTVNCTEASDYANEDKLSIH